MSRWSVRLLLIALCVAAFPFSSPAPLVYRPGEGWTYEPVGGDTKWRKLRAEDQLQVAQAAFDAEEYGMALKAAKRVVSSFPTSDFAPQGQDLVARCYEETGKEDQAFKEYQKLVEKYPKLPNYHDVLERQFAIANKFFAGKWFHLWGYVPLPPWLAGQMDRTLEMYQKVVKNGAYSPVAPQAQLKIAENRERQKELTEAVRAYDVAADRYHDRTEVASEAFFRSGLAYEKQAKSADYDQSAAMQAINRFTDFMTLFPNDSRVPDAEKRIGTLRTEQARGNYQNALFYEKKKKWAGALVYYGHVALTDPNSSYAALAQERIDAIQKRIQTP